MSLYILSGMLETRSGILSARAEIKFNRDSTHAAEEHTF